MGKPKELPLRIKAKGGSKAACMEEMVAFFTCLGVSNYQENKTNHTKLHFREMSLARGCESSTILTRYARGFTFIVAHSLPV